MNDNVVCDVKRVEVRKVRVGLEYDDVVAHVDERPGEGGGHEARTAGDENRLSSNQYYSNEHIVYNRSTPTNRNRFALGRLGRGRTVPCHMTS